MAKKATKTASSSSWKGFFNYYLSDEQKTAVKKMSLDGQATEKRIVMLTEAGYKIGVTWSFEKKAFFVTATGLPQSSGNQGYSLTQAHNDFSVALACVYIIIDDVFNFDKWPTDETGQEELNW